MSLVARTILIFLLFPTAILAADGNEPPKVAHNPCDGSAAFECLSSVGFGIALGHNNMDAENIKTAEIDNGIIRVTDSEKYTDSFWLEMHLFPSQVKNKKIGVGPFVAIQLSSDQKLFDSFAYGLMLGIKRSEDPNDHASFNIGIGQSSNHIQVLQNGYTADTAPPSGDQSIRFKTGHANGLLLIFSFDFYNTPISTPKK